MKNNKKLFEICMNIYRELYKKATPSANMDELIEKGITKKHNWFMNYYIDETKMKKIINKHIKKHKLTKMEKEAIDVEIWLGCSPTSNAYFFT